MVPIQTVEENDLSLLLDEILMTEYVGYSWTNSGLWLTIMWMDVLYTYVCVCLCVFSHIMY